MSLAVGDPTDDERHKRDEGRVDWAVHVPCRYLAGGRAAWQRLGPLVAGHDLVVVTQENRLLANLPLLLGRPKCRVALWGHGRNFQGGAATHGLAQAWKAALSRHADWWFAYTELSAGVVREFGYPADRITVLNNAIDVEGLAREVHAAAARGKAALRAAHGLDLDAPIGLFVGSLYREKRLDLLIDGAELVRRRLPNFQLVVVGAGPMEAWLHERLTSVPWVRLLGPRHGHQKAELLAAADVLLNPGLVGLGILDAFAAGLPIVTTDCQLHSPEIAYLRPDENGLMTAPHATAFAEAVADLLNDRARCARLATGSRRSAEAYGLRSMVERFCEGVLAWQASPRLRSAG
jgi:glycosyltransferase involved in cell wall biosynthesis